MNRHVSRATLLTQGVCASALIIGLALAVQAWAIFQWTSNFDSDEAMWGLMARHALQGQVPLYAYGAGYLGSAEILISTVFFWLFGPSVPALRATSLLLFAVFLTLHALLANRLWGARVALFSLLFLAVPGWLILWWTFRPIGPFTIMFICGSGALLLATSRLARPVRLAAIGALLGLGIWSYQFTAVYFIALGVVAGLRSPEWAALHNRIRQITRRPQGPLTLGAGVVCVLGILSGFVNDCAPLPFWLSVQTISRLLLVGLLAALMLALFAASLRRRQLLIGSACLAAGYAIGNFPQWLGWLALGIAPEGAASPSCIAGAPPRARLMIEQLLPVTWGVPPLQDITHQLSLVNLAWLLILALILAAFAAFAWSRRRSLLALITLSPLTESDIVPAILALLLVLPITLDVLASNTINVYCSRYMLITWQVSAVVIALSITRVLARPPRKLFGLVLLGLWAFVAFSNLQRISSEWASTGEPSAPQATAALKTFLADRQVLYGYADYWTSYPLDFLTGETLTIAPYNAIDRIPAYTRAVEAQSAQAYILLPGARSVPAEARSTDALLTALNQGTIGGPAFSRIGERLRRQRVLERQRVANWDVWLVADR